VANGLHFPQIRCEKRFSLFPASALPGPLPVVAASSGTSEQRIRCVAMGAIGFWRLTRCVVAEPVCAAGCQTKRLLVASQML